MHKVFVLGLDGATLDVMTPMMSRGELPAFAQMAAQGVHGPLQSVVPPLSPPAWVSFATGKYPGKHRIIGFTRMVPHSYRLQLVTGRDNRAQSLWNLAGREGKKVIVVNVPMTYPPQPVNGLMISGLDTPDVHSDFTYPASLKDELFSKVPEYKVNLQLGAYLQSDGRRLAALRMILRDIEARHRAVAYLMDQYPWDLFIVKFNNPDIVQHHFWKYMDPAHPDHDPGSREEFRNAIFSVYRKLDDVTSSIMGKLGQDCTFVVMSDHGAGARVNKVVYVNEWLRDKGHLRSVIKGRGKGDWLRGKLLRQLYSYGNRSLSFLFQNTSPKVRRFLKDLAPKTFSRLSLHFKFSGWLSAIDWSQTAAFLAEQECIRINVKGVYPHGTVEPRDYVTVRDRIIHELKSLRDPETQETVFEDVLTREQAFGIPDDHALPDIQLVTREAKYDITGKLLEPGSLPEETFVRTEPKARHANGMHRPSGVFFAKGPECNAEVALEDLRLVDLCPTILFALGLSLPTDMDGRVIKEAFRRDVLERCPIEYRDEVAGGETWQEPSNVYSSEEESKLVDNLKSLGYMD